MARGIQREATVEVTEIEAAYPRCEGVVETIRHESAAHAGWGTHNIGYGKVRYRGLAKKTQRIAMLLGFANLLISGSYASG